MLYKTGFEDKPLRVIIENWLYTKVVTYEDLCLVDDAERELKRRLSKTFPKPDWIAGQHEV